MALAQDADQRVLHGLATTAAGALGQQFRPLAAKMAKGRAGPVEPVRIDGFRPALSGQIGGGDLGPDPGDGVVKFCLLYTSPSPRD